MAITEKERKRALQCLNCPVCNYGRRKQRGLVFWFLKRIESSICPACKAYARVSGRKAHEPLPEEEKERLRKMLEQPPAGEPD